MSYQNCSKTVFQNKKKVIILYDLEGIIGIVSLHPTHKKRNDSLAAHELGLVIDELREAGFSSIAICCVHNIGIDDQEIYRLIDDKQIEIVSFEELATNISRYQYAVMIGFHGMANSGGRFDHTFRFDILSCEYNNLVIGEVGIFYRFLLNNNIKVILISGEGNFLHEIDDSIFVKNNIFIIESEYLSKNDIDCEFVRFRNFLKKIFSHIEDMKSQTNQYTGNIKIAVDNNVKYKILSSELYGFNVVANRFVFLTINNFLKDVICFCYALNDATKIIIERNRK